MSVIQRLKAAWMKKSSSAMPLPDLPHLDTVDDGASQEQVREKVERTIGECEAAAEDLERQLEQRRFVVSFLRDFLDRPSSSPYLPPIESRDITPVAPVRLRRQTRLSQLLAQEQVAPQVSKFFQKDDGRWAIPAACEIDYCQLISTVIQTFSESLNAAARAKWHQLSPPE